MQNFVLKNPKDCAFTLIHWAGGWRYRSHPLQKFTTDDRGMPWVISVCCLRHVTHVFVGFGSIGMPHSQQRMRPTVPVLTGIYSILIKSKVFINCIHSFNRTNKSNKIYISKKAT